MNVNAAVDRIPLPPSIKQIDESFAITSCKPLGAIVVIENGLLATNYPAIIGERINACHESVAEYRFSRSITHSRAYRRRKTKGRQRRKINRRSLPLKQIGHDNGSRGREQNAVAIVSAGNETAFARARSHARAEYGQMVRVAGRRPARGLHHRRVHPGRERGNKLRCQRAQRIQIFLMHRSVKAGVSSTVAPIRAVPACGPCVRGTTYTRSSRWTSRSASPDGKRTRSIWPLRGIICTGSSPNVRIASGVHAPAANTTRARSDRDAALKTDPRLP